MTLMPLAIFGGIGPGELMVVGLIALLLFGKRLPDVARSLGSSLTQFKKGMNEPPDEQNPNSSRPLPRDET